MKKLFVIVIVLLFILLSGSAHAQEKQQFVRVDVSVVKAVLEYLNTKPHGEVRRLYDALLRSEPIKEEKEKEDVGKEAAIHKPNADSK